jgi:hypothetical protein
LHGSLNNVWSMSVQARAVAKKSQRIVLMHYQGLNAPTAVIESCIRNARKSLNV